MKRLKNIMLMTLIAAIGMLSLSSCAKKKEKDAQKALMQLVENQNESLPKKMDNGQTLKAIKYHDNVLTFVNEVSPDTFAGIKSPEFRKATLENLRTGMKNRKLVKKIVAAKAEVKYIFCTDSDTLGFTFEPGELQ